LWEWNLLTTTLRRIQALVACGYTEEVSDAVDIIKVAAWCPNFRSKDKILRDPISYLRRVSPRRVLA
jgi:hypothetical protein